MGPKLFFGNLPWTATTTDVEDLLREKGIAFAEVKVVLDRDTGKSKGFAFVELSEGADAEAAKRSLAGATVGERDLHVEDAVSKKPTSGRGGGGSRPAGGAARRGRRSEERGGHGGRRSRGEDYGW